MCCSVLQCIHTYMWVYTGNRSVGVSVCTQSICCSVCCSVLQCVAVCVAVCCSVYTQRVCCSVCCSVLQCVAVYTLTLTMCTSTPPHLSRMCVYNHTYSVYPHTMSPIACVHSRMSVYTHTCECIQAIGQSVGVYTLTLTLCRPTPSDLLPVYALACLYTRTVTLYTHSSHLL